MRIISSVLAVCLVLAAFSYAGACGTMDEYGYIEPDTAFKCGYIKNMVAPDWILSEDLTIVVGEEAIPTEIALRAWYTTTYVENDYDE